MVNFISTTTTTLSISPNPANVGQPVTLTAIVSPASATGTVSFYDGATLLGTVALSNGTAILTLSSLTLGSHSLTAVYSGDASFSGSTSSIVTLIVDSTSISILPPAHLKGIQKANRFATQTEFINILSWQAPSSGRPPIAYRIYRDRSLTELVAVISANEKLQFKDHNRKKGKTYTYFIVSVDQSGSISTPASIKVSTNKELNLSLIATIRRLKIY